MKIAYKYLLPAFFLLALGSCKKSFLDVNTSPNSPVDVPPRTLLPNAEVALGFTNGNELGKVAALLMQYNAGIAGSQAGAYDQWNIGSLDNQWSNELYTNTINNLGIIVQKTEGTSPAYAGVAKLQLAYAFSMATDLWGDVPYSQAAQGLDENGFLKYPQPRFDAQQDIYLGNASLAIKSLFNLVREGIADINSPSILKPASDDIVYNGDLSKWTRLGYSLLMKFALQVSNKAPDTTRAVINDIVTNNRPFINDVNGTLDFNVPFSKANPNPYYLQDIGGTIPNTQLLSTRFYNLERNLNDTIRLSKFYNRPTGVYVTYDNGSPFAAPLPISSRSQYGTYVLGATRSGEAPIRLVTAFRNYFILAEAALRFGVTGDANTYYQNGIKASMISTGMTATEISNYFAANPTIVTLTGTTDQKLQQIILQKYIASVGNAIESYNDYRRTGYPVLQAPTVTAGDDPNIFPWRFPYTVQEGTSNPNQPNPRPKTNVKVWWQ
ncbi:SusD/RagB family nutrient-binding outer membrane lipoprotein [Flavisolibacter ginsenosidimutans]|uniref:SusD/RagB family nutrient-binding outer membrane lipoprotein n=1 Tax=Flavisolibacter ginsenosidimutans TaxID=661481 RepID=A0A5B8UE67_9BACT|nr:SusD/RagB family nutrient-binding outer membrane lipoprotein [Flavisolibacter ginsenosidimutans]QEC54596.1 SusD/RagB family nutrient-binding outer membrane lipoprotein [Flavisolibacter ginsenosidimutans]